MNQTLDEIIKYYSCIANEPCETCMMRGFNRFEQCQYVKDFKLALRELIEGGIDIIPITLVETSFDGVEQKYEQAVLLKEVKKALNEVLK